MRKRRVLILALLLIPLVVGAETITWTPPINWSDGTTVSTADKALYVYYLRTWKASSPNILTYFGETRNGVVTWSDNILVKANQWGAQNSVAGWIPYKAGDVIFVDVSTSWEPVGGPNLDSWPDRKGVPISYTIPGTVPPPVVAPTVTLSAAPTSIVKGACTTLTWVTTNATSVAIDQGVGTVVANGTKSVCPIVNTTYSITAIGQGGSKVASVAIIVTIPPPPVVIPGCTPPTGVTITK